MTGGTICHWCLVKFIPHIVVVVKWPCLLSQAFWVPVWIHDLQWKYAQWSHNNYDTVEMQANKEHMMGHAGRRLQKNRYADESSLRIHANDNIAFISIWIFLLSSNTFLHEFYLISVIVSAHFPYFDRIWQSSLGEQAQYHGCWSPGCLRRQDISSHNIDSLGWIGHCLPWGKISRASVLVNDNNSQKGQITK